MARFLLGWELGANRGHLVQLSAIARRLAAAGHDVAIAAQRLARDFDLPAGVAMWQAPVWPRLLVNVGLLGGATPNTMGDILVRLGLDGEDVLPALIGGWEQIVRSVAPDVVIADFAPALLRAAQGRVPVIALGTGFDCVPFDLDRFPSLTGQPAVYPEDRLLDQVNAGLARSGLATLDRLPQIFAADHVLASSFSELDPYAQWRTGPTVAPSVSHPLGMAEGGEEVFVYADASLLRTPTLWDGLMRSTLPVRVHAHGATPAQNAELARLGFAVERAPIPFADIARRSRVTMTAGGLGFVSSSLAAGLPVVVVHYDLEKALTGQAITRMQLGGHVHAGAIQADAFATSLRQLYQNESFQRRAKDLAPGFRDRLSPTQEEVATALAIRLS